MRREGRGGLKEDSVKTFDGATDNVMPARGPLWDRNWLFRSGGKRPSRYCFSTLDAASCCHPCLSPPGSNSSGSRGAGLSPTHSSNGEWHCDDVLHNLVDLAWHDVHDAAEAVEQTCVVPSPPRAMQEQRPRWLLFQFFIK